MERRGFVFIFLIKPPFNQPEQNVFMQTTTTTKNSVQNQQSPAGTGELGRENEDEMKMQETKMCTLSAFITQMYTGTACSQRKSLES